MLVYLVMFGDQPARASSTTSLRLSASRSMFTLMLTNVFGRRDLSGNVGSYLPLMIPGMVFDRVRSISAFVAVSASFRSSGPRPTAVRIWLA